MFQLTSDIQVGQFGFKGVVGCEVVSTWEALTDTCKLTIPKKLSWDGQLIALGNTPLLSKGDPLSIAFGLDGRNNKWFEGYLTQIHAGIPTVLDGQDAMFLLKKGEITRSYEKVSLSRLLKDILPPSVKHEVLADYDLGQWRVSKATPAQILEQLNKDFFVRSFFRNGTLYIGLTVVPKLQQTHRVKYLIDNNLEYIRKDDVKILLKGVVLKTDNTKEEIEVGDKDGEVRTLHRYNISTADMKRFLNQELEALKYEGYRGTFTTLIEPNVNHGDIVEIVPNLYDLEHEGKYLVKRVTKTFDGTAARQEIELERRIY
jgi:hypothetical protein